MLKAVKCDCGILEIIDQLLMPTFAAALEVKGVEEAWSAINKWQVRGDGATAILVNLVLAIEVAKKEYEDKKSIKVDVEAKLNHLLSAAPTSAVLINTHGKLLALANRLFSDTSLTTGLMKRRLVDTLRAAPEKDFTDCKTLGAHGAKLIEEKCKKRKAKVLTHGNTGSLATAGWGTALGVIRSLRDDEKLEHVYFTETRSSNAGAYITAYELKHENIPATLIVDGLAATLLRTRKIDAIVVGARAIAKNGDIINDIGTYVLALAAKAHNVPFYVAATLSTINRKAISGDRITIGEELCKPHIITVKNMPTWNPSYDTTPASYITAFITEKGIVNPKDLAKLKPK